MFAYFYKCFYILKCFPGEYQAVKCTSLVAKADKGKLDQNQQDQNQRMSDEGIGLDLDDLHTTPVPNGTTAIDISTPDVFTSSDSSTGGSADAVVVAPPDLTPGQVKLGNKFEKQPLLNESPLRLHSPSEPDGYPEKLPEVKKDTKNLIRVTQSACQIWFMHRRLGKCVKCHRVQHIWRPLCIPLLYQR